jgi:hypothetical protein
MSAQSLGSAATEVGEGAMPQGRRRGSDEVLKHPDLEVGDSAQVPIIAQQRGGSLFQAGGDLQLFCRAVAILGAQLSGALPAGQAQRVIQVRRPW